MIYTDLSKQTSSTSLASRMMAFLSCSFGMGQVGSPKLMDIGISAIHRILTSRWALMIGLCNWICKGSLARLGECKRFASLSPSNMSTRGILRVDFLSGLCLTDWKSVRRGCRNDGCFREFTGQSPPGKIASQKSCPGGRLLFCSFWVVEYWFEKACLSKLHVRSTLSADTFCFACGKIQRPSI